MTPLLLGPPRPLNLAAPSAAARELLLAYAERRLDPAEARLPGVYLLFDGEQPVGFWLVLDAAWLDDPAGDAGAGPPPLVRELLEGANEGKWWEGREKKDGAIHWDPLIVFEWTPGLSVRAGLAPPGSTRPAAAAAPAEVDFIDLDALAATPTSPGIIPAPPREPPRSLLFFARGYLKKRVSDESIAGHFAALSPVNLPAGPWLEALCTERPDWPATHQIGAALELPLGGAGYPLTGWLGADLGVHPDTPADHAAGGLAAHQTRHVLRDRIRMGVLNNFLVIVAIASFSMTVRCAAAPTPQPTVPTPIPAPQPAISVCSQDHAQFVQELRCQFAAASDSTLTVENPICGDFGAAKTTNSAGSTDEDLRPVICALFDRGTRGSATWDDAEFLASQACFNVLGRPAPYKQEGSELGDPMLLLADPNKRVDALAEMVDGLRDACDAQRDRLEPWLRGAAFAAHIHGDLTPESDSLLAHLVDTLDEAGRAPACFQDGASVHGVLEEYDRICPSETEIPVAAAVDRLWSDSKLPAAQTLRGAPTDPLGRYTEVRFGGLRRGGEVRRADARALPDPWSCHLALSGLAPALLPVSAAGEWDVPVPVPRRYGTGAVASQLVLDAALSQLDAEGADFGPCWAIVAETLEPYTPVHPLLADPGLDWPNPGQQVCGQVCAARYRVVDYDGPWWTKEADLDACLDRRAPADVPPVPGPGFERLRVPWYSLVAEARVRRRLADQLPTACRNAEHDCSFPPPAEALCAYNLVAQGYLGDGEKGVLVGDVAPEDWAGASDGSGVVGSDFGLAADAARDTRGEGLYGAQTMRGCGHLASACFMNAALEITGSNLARPSWVRIWDERFERADEGSRGLDPVSLDPWCSRIDKYLRPQPVTAALNTPCVVGVEDARSRVRRHLASIAAATEESP